MYVQAAHVTIRMTVRVSISASGRNCFYPKDQEVGCYYGEGKKARSL